MPADGFLAKFFRGLTDAVADVREKVVEEPTYGRALSTSQVDGPHWPKARETQDSMDRFYSVDRDQELDR